MRGLGVMALLLVLLGQWAGRPADAAQPATEWPALTPVQIVTGLSLPTTITHAGDGSRRLFVTDQGGRIQIVRDGAVLPTPFLDIASKVSCCSEQGLLGLAFPPGYTGKGYFYVNYTDTQGDTVIARYRLTANPDVADPASEQILLTVAQPYANHNGGQLAFGPNDGDLYIGLGDGGSANDPQNRAQNLGTLLGKLLRIDVENAGSAPYAIPPSNPFVGNASAKAEIWASGLRNPWRFSFDRQTADLYLGDVGQNMVEEIDYQPASSAGGENYGWRLYEGDLCPPPGLTHPCNPAGLTFPIYTYPHSAPTGQMQGCSVTGGYVYRGDTYPRLRGIYVFGDYCKGTIAGLRRNGSTWETRVLATPGFPISTFGEDEAGDIYVAARYGVAGTGTIYTLTDPTPVSATPTSTLTAEPTSTPTPTNTASPTSTPTDTTTPTPTATATPTPSPTSTALSTAANTATATPTSPGTSTSTATTTPGATPTETPYPTPTRTSTSGATSTTTVTPSPTVPAPGASPTPTPIPTSTPIAPTPPPTPLAVTPTATAAANVLTLAVNGQGPTATDLGLYVVHITSPAPVPGPLTVVFTLPPGITFVSGEGVGFTCTADGQVVTCVNPDGVRSAARATNPRAASSVWITVKADTAVAPTAPVSVQVTASGLPPAVVSWPQQIPAPTPVVPELPPLVLFGSGLLLLGGLTCTRRRHR